ncbi:hypothetical protein, conserved [Eimeria tenella]|uniref:G domain-containing protein n=1 Tax=Eimeria tenella TaxID=5802 RepID=U6KSQ0_EIMTE|nr:hypothetical protein, conserved [Eimeria tenella]CDJ40986.1 hypothetical protein, conserved [Eimeria tenella]|eukprot:XP_013231736.1 hypothetical protein, conserved [Eimeria tenella]
MQQNSPKFRVRTSLLTCQRCYRIQHYRSIDVEREWGVWGRVEGLEGLSVSSVVSKVVCKMPRSSLVIKLVDVCDLEASVVPELFESCRQKGLRVLWALNRVDCLPRDTNLNEVRHWVRRMVRQIRNVHIDDCVLISSATGFGFDTLERRIGEILSEDTPRLRPAAAAAAAGDGALSTAADAYEDAQQQQQQQKQQQGRFIFVVGRVNSGKSTFVNRFLKFVGYKHFGTLHLKRAVGGATRSPLPGTTLDILPFGLPKGFKLIDTPGVPSEHQVTGLLRQGFDLFSVVPTKRMQPLTYPLKKGQTLIVGSLARIDLVEGATALCTCYFSHRVTLHICK